MIEVSQDPLGMAVVALRDAADFSSAVPVSSGRARFSGAVSLVKRAIAKALGWHTRWIIDQMHTFGSNAVAASELVVDRLHDHDRALTQLKAQLHSLTLHGGGAGEGAERQPLPAAAAGGAEPRPSSASVRSQQVER